MAALDDLGRFRRGGNLERLDGAEQVAERTAEAVYESVEVPLGPGGVRRA
jgi:hypothetical protein